MDARGNLRAAQRLAHQAAGVTGPDDATALAVAAVAHAVIAVAQALLADDGRAVPLYGVPMREDTPKDGTA